MRVEQSCIPACMIVPDRSVGGRTTRKYVSIQICALYRQSGSDRLAGGPF